MVRTKLMMFTTSACTVTSGRAARVPLYSWVVVMYTRYTVRVGPTGATSVLASSPPRGPPGRRLGAWKIGSSWPDPQPPPFSGVSMTSWAK